MSDWYLRVRHSRSNGTILACKWSQTDGKPRRRSQASDPLGLAGVGPRRERASANDNTRGGSIMRIARSTLIGTAVAMALFGRNGVVHAQASGTTASNPDEL